MKTASVNVRIREDVKSKAEEILVAMGVSRATAIDMFYRQIIMHNGIPFPVTIPEDFPVRDNLTDSEFNEIMRSGYAQALAGDSSDLNGVIDDLVKGL